MVPLSSAGFARAILSPLGEVRKGGVSPPPSSTGLGDLLPVAVSGVQDLLRRGLLHRHRDLLAALAQHLSPGVVTEAGARRDEPAHDDVLLQAAQVVGLAADGRLGQHPGRFLEGGSRDEAVRGQRGLGDAEEDRLGGGRGLTGRGRLVVLLLEDELVHELAHHEVGAADLLDAHAPEHLAHDDLDVLVVDRHALQAIDLLHLVHEIALQLAIAQHGQVVVGVGRAVHERLSRLDPVSFVHGDVLAARNQVLLGLPVIRADDDLAHALDEAGELHRAVDFGDDGLLLGLARLEELGHPRETARDVLGLGRLARDLGDDVTLVHLGAVSHQEMGAHGQHVAAPRLAHRLRIGRVVAARRRRRLHGHPRLELAFLILDDHASGETRDLVELLADGDAVHDVAEGDGPAHLGEDGRGEGIPLHEQLAHGHLALVLDLDAGARHHRVPLLLTAALVHHHDLAVPVEHDDVVVPIHHGADIVILYDARVLGVVLGGLHHPARRAADVEGAHGELSARLPDGLGGDDAYRLPELREAARAQVAAVAHDADAALRLAGERGADAYPLQAGVLDLLRQFLVDLGAGLHDDLARERIADVLRGHAPEHAIAQRLDDVAAFDERRGVDVLHGAAVVLGHDDVLGDVDEAPGEVTRVRRLEGGVGQTLAGAVGGGEVLQHGEAFAEVGGNGRLDDLARGLGHETAHPRQLADLLLGAAGAGVGHHVDGIELAALLAAFQLAEHGIRNLLRGVGPDVDHLVVALAVGDDAVLVLLLHLIDLPPRPVDQLALGGRDVHVLDADGQAGQSGIAEADVLEVVEEGHGRLVAEAVVALADERADLLLLELLVHEAEGLRHHVVQQRAAHRGLDDAAVVAEADARLQVDVLVVVGDARLFRIGEEPAFTLGPRPLLGEVVDPEDHVLGGDGHGRAVGRREDVVGGEHQ